MRGLPVYGALLAISSDPLSMTPPEAGGDQPSLLEAFGERGRELLALLSLRNGFFAFESSLLVRAAGSCLIPRGLAEWNAHGLWIAEYPMLSDAQALFFAEDIFGNQFALRDEAVQKFDAETSELEPFARTISEWAEAVMRNYEYETGHPVGHEWQGAHGALPPGHRLCPRLPFVCGGEFSATNLVALEEVVGMRARGNLARELRTCPDGTQIVFRVAE